MSQLSTCALLVLPISDPYGLLIVLNFLQILLLTNCESSLTPLEDFLKTTAWEKEIFAQELCQVITAAVFESL